MKTASAYILYTPLTVSLFMDERGGSVSQSKSGTDGTFSPDRTLFPLILRPRLEVADSDHVISNGDRTASLIDCRWYIGNDEGGIRITSGSGGFVLGAYGELQVMRNVEPDTPMPLYFACAFIDPRNGKTFRKSWSMTLSSTLATELQLSLEIDAASKQPVSPFKSQSVRVINATFRNGEDTVDDAHAVYAWKLLVRGAGGTPSLRSVGEEDLFYVSGQGTKSLTIDRRFIDKELLVLEAYHTAAPGRICSARTKIYRWYGQWDDVVHLTRGRFIRPDTTEIESVVNVQTPKGDISSPASYFDITHVLTTNERGASEEVIGYGERVVVPVSKLSKDPNVVPVFGIETRERSALRACVIDGKRVVINGKIMCIQIPI